MNWLPYVVSLGVGLGVGVIYGLLTVRSPAPPVIALLGLLGMLAGETLTQYVRGHSDSIGQAVSRALHLKSFEAPDRRIATGDDGAAPAADAPEDRTS